MNLFSLIIEYFLPGLKLDELSLLPVLRIQISAADFLNLPAVSGFIITNADSYHGFLRVPNDVSFFIFIMKISSGKCNHFWMNDIFFG